VRFDRKKLAADGIRQALRVRQTVGINMCDPINIFDFVESQRVEVWFGNVGSLEGMYSKDPGPMILLSCERPPGRQVFTCAHEYAHHVFDHGTQIDQYVDGQNRERPNEFLADCFAGALLMPPTAVRRAFVDRGWEIRNPTATQLYIVSSFFGVGFTSLAHHMTTALGLMTHALRDKMLKARLIDIRSEILSERCESHLIVVNHHWIKRPVDLQIGDQLLAPHRTLDEGACLRRSRELKNGVLFEAEVKGIGRLADESNRWSVFVRVGDKNYVGRCRYRYLAEPQDD
jgi:Zn-dependent peptidase ImmA (M78 family)